MLMDWEFQDTSALEPGSPRSRAAAEDTSSKSEQVSGNITFSYTQHSPFNLQISMLSAGEQEEACLSEKLCYHQPLSGSSAPPLHITGPKLKAGISASVKVC
ncbi:hypothetical protein QTP86_011321 [Hemibagrus guttatus]|nr:hypothetical protein QTP86_011321 [Hemibagrus guttatus]